MIKVISGGQTGVDRYALEIAKSLNIPTGGTAPQNFYTDNGPDPSLKDFGLTEGRIWGYVYRTERNVIDSDATVLFGDLSSPGCKLTIRLCKRHRKPYFENPTSDTLASNIVLYNIKVLNFAGNREKNIPEPLRQDIKQTITNALLKTLTI
jgi:hypothetical protein